MNCHSYYSFKYGAVSIEQLLDEAQSKEITKLALTDINNTSGCLDFIRLAPRYNIEPVVGIDFRQGTKQLFVGIARDNEGFYELNKFLSDALLYPQAMPIQPPAFQHAYIIYPFEASKNITLRENEFIGIRPSDLNKLLFSDKRFIGNKLVALNTASFRNKKDFNAHRLLRAIDNNTLLSKLSITEQGSEADSFFFPNQIREFYNNHSYLLENAERLLNDCSIGFTFKESKNKKTYTGDAKQDLQLLKEECLRGIEFRYGKINDVLQERLTRELNLIESQGFAAYFLINWDLLKYARSKGYFYVGRGSGANSIVAYCLSITDVDPIELDLYFERFINEFRKNPPDFDLDFSWKDREDITRYIFDEYPTATLLGSYNTFQNSAVIRELGKVFGLPKAEIDNLVLNRKKPVATDNISNLIIKYSQYIHGFPNHLSVHTGGVLIPEQSILYYTGTIVPPKGYRTTQFSMLEAEDIGLYKFDILSQRGLGHIKDTIELVKKNQGVDVNIHDINKFKEDPKIKEHLRKGQAMGCFYVESPAMRMLLKKLGADDYLSLVAASSIIRPGVAQSGMMREYILRFRHPERRDYIHPVMKDLMEETFGIMVYQEDVIKVAHHFAGMSLSEADVLRRGMSGKFQAREEFQKAKDNFIEGCRKKGYPDAITLEVWRQVESFAGYSFSKGHSASYAVESYQSMYLKAYYPLEFMVGVINNFGGFYKTEFYVHEARMNGANIFPPCVNKSEYLTCIYGKDIYLGFIHIGELEQKIAERIVHERITNGSYKGLEDFVKRINISLEQLRVLIRIGALKFTGRTKKELLWDMYALLGNKKATPAKKELFEIEARSFDLPELHYNSLDDALHEMEILGFPLCSPFLLTETPVSSDITSEDLLKYTGHTITISGYLVCTKISRTKRGEDMVFGTFVDTKGHFFDTTHFPNALERSPFRGSGCYQIKGKVAVEFEYPSIEVSEMEKLSWMKRD